MQEFEPEAIRLAGPALGAVALAASTSLASDLPFIIVRGETKEYGTANRIEGVFEQGELGGAWRTSSRPAALSRRPSPLRGEGLFVRNAVCVVDREEVDRTLSRASACGCALFRARDLLEMRKTAAKRHG